MTLDFKIGYRLALDRDELLLQLSLDTHARKFNFSGVRRPRAASLQLGRLQVFSRETARLQLALGG